MEQKKLNFGCGNDIRKGWDNVDIQKGKDIAKSFDFGKFPYPIKDNVYDYIFLSQVLEHLEKPEKVLLELRRICKPGGIIRIEVTYYNNKGAFNSLEHIHYFSDETFRDFVEERKVIDKQRGFKIQSLYVTPTIIGKFFPYFIRRKLSLFIGGLMANVEVELKIIK